MINSKEFIARYAKTLDISEKDAKIQFETFLNTLKQSLTIGEEVRFLNFGSFQLIREAQRDKDEYAEAKTRLEFRPSKGFLDNLEV